MTDLKITVKPEKIRLVNLLEEVGKGTYKVPIFQRDFIWKKSQMIQLFDSILKGYPIGSLLFWKPEVQFQTKINIGPYEIQSAQKIQTYNYILDGSQRITTLYSVLTNPNNYNKTENKDFTIYFDLDKEEFLPLKGKGNPKYIIALYKVIDTFEFIDFLRDLEKEVKNKIQLAKYIKNAKNINKILVDYEIPYVEINGGDIKSAVDIFSRINSTGVEISKDYMLSALSYNEKTNFQLSDQITEFINKLEQFNFDSIKRDIIMDCIETSTGNIYFDVDMEDLTGIDKNLEEITKAAFVHIEKAVWFLYNHLNVIENRLLPYPSQLIFLSEFFRCNPNPDKSHLKKLERWFWFTSYSNYFTMYSLSQQRSAYFEMRSFAENQSNSDLDGIYRLPNISFSTARFPDKLNNRSVRTKTLQLFFLKNILSGNKLEKRDTIKEFFLHNKKERSPAQMILRLSSEFETKKELKELDLFLKSLAPDEMEKYFLTPEMIELYFKKRIDELLVIRDLFIKEKEKSFVESLGIAYSENDGNE